MGGGIERLPLVKIAPVHQGVTFFKMGVLWSAHYNYTISRWLTHVLHVSTHAPLISSKNSATKAPSKNPILTPHMTLQLNFPEI